MKKILLLILLVLFMCGCTDKDDFDASQITTDDIEYASVANTFINTVKKKVGSSIAIFDEKSLYLVPVGSDNSQGCSGTDDYEVYGFPHVYAYVGVVKSGNLYYYYYMSRDEGGSGYNFTKEATVKNKGRGIYKEDKLYNYAYLAKTYNVKGSSRDKTIEVALKDVDVNDSIKNVLGGSYTTIEKVKIFTYSVCN